MPFRVRLEKENFKFSCSHFTLFGPSEAERLHGHNYYVSVEIGLKALDPVLGMAFDFNDVKPLVRKLTEAWDERVLLPGRSPYLKIEAKDDSFVVSFGKKKYEFPQEDALVLPTVNVTSEELARLLAENLAAALKTNEGLEPRLDSLTVGVEETRGQSVYCEIEL